ncbi:hypothetical protein M885DRAFT_516416 [Pelagophyceae sp. CCMP2097]|nr:hypothetical protein M885DRAFT_516416 [Pelagophyceae sp. CCMP2097]
MTMRLLLLLAIGLSAVGPFADAFSEAPSRKASLRGRRSGPVKPVRPTASSLKGPNNLASPTAVSAGGGAAAGRAAAGNGAGAAGAPPAQPPRHRRKRGGGAAGAPKANVGVLKLFTALLFIFTGMGSLGAFHLFWLNGQFKSIKSELKSELKPIS